MRENTATASFTRNNAAAEGFGCKGTAGTLTIEENLILAERRSGRRRLKVPGGSDRRRELLEQLGMGLEHRLSARVDSLSGGQRQAMAVLMAIQSDPSLLMLDEHTAALDPAAAERVLDVTTRLASQTHITTLMITHNMNHAIQMGDRTVMMHRGKSCSTSTPNSAPG